MNYPEPPPPEYWRNKTVQDRRKWIQHVFIPHPRVQKAVVGIQSWMDRCNTTGRGAGIYIQGETGSGKTRLSTYIKDQLMCESEHVSPDRTLKSAITVELPAVCSEKQIAIQILNAMRDPRPNKGSYRELKDRIHTLFRECQVRVVFVDDIHNLVVGPNLNGATKVFTVICDLIDVTNALFVLMGDRRSQVIVDNILPLRRRVPFRLALPYFDVIEPARREEFKKLMVELQKWLPLAESSQLESKDLAGRLFAATGGIFGHFITLLDFAWPIAVDSGREHLVRADLAIAFEKLYGDVLPNSNPFADGFVLRPLDQPGEQFHGWV